MRIFLTGGTGQIGRAVTKLAISQGHGVTTLARSEKSAEIQKSLGASPIMGSLTDPSGWVDLALEHDAFIHAAATFDTDMGDVDHNLMAALSEQSRNLPEGKQIPFIFTGGCWLYPEEPVIPITERHVLDPLPEFAWMLESIEQLHSCPRFRLTVIHPALVNDNEKGTIVSYANQLREKGKISLVASKDIHFPFIHADDLADLYLKAIAHAGNGLILNATAIKSATAGEVANLVATHTGLPCKIEIISIEEIQDEIGNWASGYARSQRMSSNRARDLLDWQPRFDTIEAIVEQCLKTD
ncbi:NAD-dependent epimerase/dehydratase family protein [uncultured Cohaesibacter sp.]|uniref:NAD-dependent epimerase/dehydratase family protein n=1 Tax=uncultured Cohaesibacter sp. TaxID=1002546 RepID=UPI002931D5AE|nr:NAD-dependent epimerase/dehydratase family protein [uncultured Cohaesibacter sp.]